MGGSSGANLGFIFCGLIFVLLDGYSATRIFGKWGSNEFFFVLVLILFPTGFSRLSLLVWRSGFAMELNTKIG